MRGSAETVERGVGAPELVDPRQQRDAPIPDVAGVVDEAVAHLHLRVLQPGGGVGVRHVQRALPHTARPPEVLLPLLPLRVLRHTSKLSMAPCRDMHPSCILQSSEDQHPESCIAPVAPALPHDVYSKTAMCDVALLHYLQAGIATDFGTLWLLLPLCMDHRELLVQGSGCCRHHLHPDAAVPSHTAHQILKLFALAQAVLCKLCLICDLLLGCLEVSLLQLPGFPEDLLCCDLQYKEARCMSKFGCRGEVY